MARDMLFVTTKKTKKEVSAMSRSLLYHAFNLKDVEYCSTKFIGTPIIFSVEMKDKFIKCPACSWRQAVFKVQKTL